MPLGDIFLQHPPGSAVVLDQSVGSSTGSHVEAAYGHNPDAQECQADFTEKFFVGADGTKEFPFLVTELSPYYES